MVVLVVPVLILVVVVFVVPVLVRVVVVLVVPVLILVVVVFVVPVLVRDPATGGDQVDVVLVVRVKQPGCEGESPAADAQGELGRVRPLDVQVGIADLVGARSVVVSQVIELRRIRGPLRRREPQRGRDSVGLVQQTDGCTEGVKASVVSHRAGE